MNTLRPAEASELFAHLATIGGFRCEGCGAVGATVHRQNTQYVDDAQNWRCLCEPCHKENADNWADVWSDYYANCM